MLCGALLKGPFPELFFFPYCIENIALFCCNQCLEVSGCGPLIHRKQQCVVPKALAA